MQNGMSDLPLVPLLGLQGLTVEVLDVGATVGAGRHGPLAAQGLARVTAIDPAAENTAALLASGVDRVLPVYLGDGAAATLHATRDPAYTALYEPDPAVIDLFAEMGSGAGGNFQVVHTTPVQTARLDDVLPDLRPDFIRLDVQGSELAVMQHGLKALGGATVIEAECALVPVYKGQPLFGDLQVFLRRHGFMLHKLIDVAGRGFLPLAPPNQFEPISQLLWADAVFVRDFAALPAYADAQLLKGALILNDMYHSFDLALRLLAEHDRRRSTGYGPLYHQALQSAPALHPQFLTIKAQP